MQRIRLLGAVLLAGLVCHASADPLQVSPESLFERVSPAVVRIETKDDFGQSAATGSGFIISIQEEALPADRRAERAALEELHDAGKLNRPWLVVTNFHVIRGAVEGSVRYVDGTMGSVSSVEAEDESLDLAVLSVEATAKKPGFAFPINLDVSASGPANAPPAPSTLRVGAKVFAIGSPLGLTNTLSEGLVSGFRPRPGGTEWVQTTAPVSPGSSGGPLLDSTGAVVGITTALLEAGQNLNFAVPVADLRVLLRRPESSGRMLWEARSIEKTEDYAFLGASSSLLLWQFETETGATVFQADYRERFREYMRTTELQDAPALLLRRAWTEYHDSQHEASLRTLEAAQQALVAISKGSETAATFRKPPSHLISYLKAKALCELELSTAAKPTGRFSSGLAYYPSSVFKGTITAAKKAKEENPEFPPTYALLYQVYSGTEKLAEAFAEADTLVRLMPYSGTAFANRANAYEALDRHEDAIADYTRAIDLNPSDTPSMYRLGYEYIKVGKPEQAVVMCDRALSLELHRPFPADHLFYRCRGYAYEQLNNPARAIGEYQRAMVGDDGDHGFYRTRIEACRAKLAGERR